MNLSKKQKEVVKRLEYLRTFNAGYNKGLMDGLNHKLKNKGVDIYGK